MRAAAESQSDGGDDASADGGARRLGRARHGAAASRYPTLAAGTLVPATRAATGFPSIPGVAFTDHFVNAVLDYDFGQTFGYDDLAGVIARQPPVIKQVIPTLVPRVNADGNETAGIPSVLHQAPSGRISAGTSRRRASSRGRSAGFSGGYVPFAVTGEARTKGRSAAVNRGTARHARRVCAVKRAARELVRDRFLLQSDADRVIESAAKASVLPRPRRRAPDLRRIADLACRSSS